MKTYWPFATAMLWLAPLGCGDIQSGEYPSSLTPASDIAQRPEVMSASLSNNIPSGSPTALYSSACVSACVDYCSEDCSYCVGFVGDAKSQCFRRCADRNARCTPDCKNKCTSEARNPPPFEFDVNGNREGWTVYNMSELTSGPSGGTWILRARPCDVDPMLVGPIRDIDTSVIKKVIIGMANDHNPDTDFQLFWATDTAGDAFSESASKWVTVPADGGWREYTLDLSSHPAWTGVVRRLRMDPLQTGNGNGFGFDYVRFAK